jgi:hypothetical protein
MAQPKEIKTASWEECEGELLRIEDRHSSDPLGVWFRGQSNSAWEILTTLERRLRAVCPVEGYFASMRRIKSEIEAFTGTLWEMPSYEIVLERTRTYDRFIDLISAAYSFMAHLRHHGYPSPLLDWTRSPYVAAFFAFAEESESGDAAIFAYSERPQRFKVGGSDVPAIFPLGPLVRTHQRHFRQQSRYTICAEYRADLGWSYAPHQTVFELGDEAQDLLYKIIVPSSERKKVLAKLDRFNLNAFSLFGSEESLLETLERDDFRLTRFGIPKSGLF